MTVIDEIARACKGHQHFLYAKGQESSYMYRKGDVVPSHRRVMPAVPFPVLVSHVWRKE